MKSSEIARHAQAVADACKGPLPAPTQITFREFPALPYVIGVWFVESETNRGTYYRCTGRTCTCKGSAAALKAGRVCKHVRKASEGIGVRAEERPAVANPFKVAR